MNSIALVLVTLLAAQCRGEPLRGIRGYGGDCPFQRPSVHCVQASLFSSGDEAECFADDECLPSLKCCMQGCTSKCVPPVHYSRWCQAPVDLAILFDAQASTWPRVKRMINKLIHGMSITRKGTHVALRTISKHSQLLLGFDQLTGNQINRVNVWSIIKASVPEKRSGKLSTALKNAKDMFNGKNGARENGIKVLLVLTDANMDFEESSAVQAATKELRDANVLVQTVGVTMEMNLMHLVEIATSDVYVWPGVDHEMLSGLKKLEKEPCHFK